MFMQLMKTLPPSPKGWDVRIVAVFQLSTLLFSALSFSWLTVEQDTLVGCIKPEYWLNQESEPEHLQQLHVHLASLTKKNNVMDTESKVSSLVQSTPTPEHW